MKRAQGLVEYVGLLIAIAAAVAGLAAVIVTTLGEKVNSF